MLLLTPKLSEKTINNQLLKFFAKLQMDEQVPSQNQTTHNLFVVMYIYSEFYLVSPASEPIPLYVWAR